MSARRMVVVTASALLTIAAGGCARQDRAASAGDARQAILAAEDARAPTLEQLATLLEGMRSEDPGIQQLAVRGVGRLERPTLVPEILPLVSAKAPEVRSEAANALGQAIQGSARSNAEDPLPAVVKTLRQRLSVESDADVRSAIYRTLGRLPYRSSPLLSEVEAVLVDATQEGPRNATVLLGSVKGLEALFRLNGKDASATGTTLARLRQIVRAPVDSTSSTEAHTGARIRRVALAALIAARGVDSETLRAALQDPDDQVRRLAAVGAGSTDAMNRLGMPHAIGTPVDGRAALIDQALRDRSAMVRYDALHAHAAHLQSESCGPILHAVRDPAPHVLLLALDLLGNGCPAPERRAAIRSLLAAVQTLPPPAASAPGTRVAWHAAARGLVALARLDPREAARRMSAFATHEIWQVRMYAARAATSLEDAATLDRLARDQHPNVRTAAVGGLARVAGQKAHAIYLEALAAPDYQLARAAARALAGSPNRAEAVPALLSALSRLTAERRDTSRDPRVAILERLAELGSRDQVSDLTPYLTDFDPRVAERAAAALKQWTGTDHPTAPSPLPIRPPDVRELERYVASVARVTVRGVGSFDMKLLPEEAPATVARFVRLVNEGYYNGLTYHRVVPNWLIQGGSPGANEFMGDGPYLRDELGLYPRVRGAVGTSTRGRDTGDAQMAIDVADNLRLEHQYTVFAQVVQGMDVVDRVLEGDVIERIEIRPLHDGTM
ncbi:MAG: HEAT repeat domain-containing protein [Vicinamibacterales bacterium]